MINDNTRFILDSMPFSIWLKDLNGNIVFTNKKFNRLYNIDGDNYQNIQVEICGKCQVRNICEERINNVIKNKVTSKFEVAINDMNMQCYISPYFIENSLIGILGILVDIESTREKQKQLEERENILRTIIDTLPNYIFYKDKDCKYVGYNKRWEEHYKKLGIENMIGKTDLETNVVPMEMAVKFIKQDEEVIRTKKMLRQEHKSITEEGKERISETLKVPVINNKGEVWGIVGLSTDITEKINIRNKLTTLSYTDVLTGVYNRAFFEEKKEELNKEENLPIGIIMGDVNGLKVINDTFGHLEGDKLLKSIADILKKVTTKEDFIFRWGGDEFIILIPNCNEKRCEDIIKQIVDNCSKGEFDLIDMSISLGSSIKTETENDIYENVKEAEEKLYRQKFLQEKSIRSSIIFSLNQSLQEKNLETELHANRLMHYAHKIGQRLGFTTAQLDDLELVTKLHDIGKIGINEDILLKPGKLTDEEFKIIKTHPEKGYRILQAAGELSHVAKGVLAHHERYDGKGYPLGLKADEIPIASRIVNVVDSYDAMISDRGYNIVKSKKEAIEEIKQCSGYQFDPKISNIFIDILESE